MRPHVACGFASASPQFAFTTFEGKIHSLSTEVALIKRALNDSDGVVAQAARKLNIQRTTLIEKMRKYGLSKKSEQIA